MLFSRPERIAMPWLYRAYLRSRPLYCPAKRAALRSILGDLT